MEVRTENWIGYRPDDPFDGIISIGAFEHFARPDDTPAGKHAVYRDFFTKCHEWLRPGGLLSLQTVAYANMSAEDASPFFQQEIFPNAELPTLAEISAAADGLFEIRSLTNGRLDYARTCEAWVSRLKARREEAEALVGPEMTARFVRYLTMSAVGFRMEKLGLLRIVLRPYRRHRFGS
ncbi:class I SAM-dependent methyltransferase [Micromonospora sp. DT4]|uniref:class I SAM-dependent methyltransferase n=1 Tax=Micromonospora sp. DT4 TaxID=3393438 RepID=UPI003CF11CDA